MRAAILLVLAVATAASDDFLSQLQLEDSTPHEVKLGQVGGLALDDDGNIHVFHRGPRVWNATTFGSGGHYRHRDAGPIKEDTMLVMTQDGEVVHSGMGNTFYMPHGLAMDHEGNMWLTDVAMHQVFKFAPGASKPALVLGTAFEPGNDETHFCQPTDVAVASNGDFFVADGYCNSRIVKFSPTGKVLAQWGKPSGPGEDAGPGHFRLPHGLALIEDWDMICVADRENSRIQCFAAGLTERGPPAGTFIKKAEGLGRVYGIDSKNHYLVGVSSSVTPLEQPTMFLVDLETGKSRSFKPNLSNPHAVIMTVNDQGEPDAAYVGEIGPNGVRRVDF